MKRFLLLLSAAATLATPALAQDYQARVARVLRTTPLIDGHNDWPEALREREGDARWTKDLNDLSRSPVRYNTDIARLRRGMVGGQFWSVWVSATLPGLEQVKQTIEQIELVRAIAARYPETFALARRQVTPGEPAFDGGRPLTHGAIPRPDRGVLLARPDRARPAARRPGP